MCGITGLFDTRGRRDLRRRPAAPHERRRSHHRGPDEGSLHIEPGVGLGHRRLSIIDLSTGQQPLFNEDGSVVVVFNGEIYNYQELIPELQALGHVFHTKQRHRVIVHAWESWGEDCVRAFAACSPSRCGTATADPVHGARPPRRQAAVLRAARRRHAAVRLRAEVAAGSTAGSSRDIDPLAVEEYFALGYVAEPRTIFKQARKLPPAHSLRGPRGQPMPSRANTGTCASRSTTR
jgi:asparagine synthase (glutamine-hydrolysing)